MSVSSFKKIAFLGNFSARDPKLVDHKSTLALQLNKEFKKTGSELILMEYARRVADDIASECRVINVNELPIPPKPDAEISKFDFDKHATYGRFFDSEEDQAKWKHHLENLHTRITHCLNFLDIKIVLVWNGFSPLHRLLKEFCEQTNRPIFFLETGIVPGSFEIDTRGSQCLSLPVQNPEWLHRYKPTNDEVDTVEKYVDSCLNRRLSKKNHGTPGLPFSKNQRYLFFAGTEVFSTAIEPKRNELSRAWSPYFPSEKSAVYAVAKCAEDHDLEVVYKQHPNVSMHKRELEKLPSNVRLINNTEVYDLIENACGTITLASTVIAISAMKALPSLLIGSNGLRHSGGCFQLEQRERLSDSIDLMLNRSDDHAAIQFSRLIEFFTKFTYAYGFSYSAEHESIFNRGPKKTVELIEMVYHGEAFEESLLSLCS